MIYDMRKVFSSPSLTAPLEIVALTIWFKHILFKLICINHLIFLIDIIYIDKKCD